MMAEILDERQEELAFEERLAKRRRRRFGTMSAEPRAYLALVPLWTQELAARCKFVSADQWDDFQQQAQGLDLLEYKNTYTAEG
ncbi:MAG: hypothetical protein PVI09_21015, partial [Anaerolineae bacterium]